MNWRRRILSIVLGSGLGVAASFFFFTGSPIPLWKIERLDAPLQVKSIGDSHLELADGRKIALPFMKSLPQNNPLFQEAISNGIEISPTGEAFGLMWLDRNCGLDPYLWRKLRVNLSDLAAALDPARIDDRLVHPDAIAFIQEHKQINHFSTRSPHDLQLRVGDLSNMNWIRRQFEWSKKESVE